MPGSWAMSGVCVLMNIYIETNWLKLMFTIGINKYWVKMWNRTHQQYFETMAQINLFGGLGFRVLKEMWGFLHYSTVFQLIS